MLPSGLVILVERDVEQSVLGSNSRYSNAQLTYRRANNEHRAEHYN